MNKTAVFASFTGTLLLEAGLGYWYNSSPSEESTIKDVQTGTAPKMAYLGESSIPVPPGRKPEPAKTRPSWDHIPLDNLIARYAKMDPDQLLTELKSQAASKEQNRNNRNLNGNKLDTALWYLCNRLRHLAPRKALSAVQSMGNQKDFYAELIIESWTEHSPNESIAYLTENNTPMNLERAIARGMRNHPPEQVWAWLKGLDAHTKNNALPIVLTNIIEVHPDLASAYINQLSPKDGENREIRTLIAKKWAATDWEATKAWIDSLNTSQDKDLLLNSALGSLAQSDFDKASKEYHNLPKEKTEAANIYMLMSLSNISPAMSIEWLERNMPDAEHPNPTMVINMGSCLDPSLHDRVLRMKSGPQKDAIIKYMLDMSFIMPQTHESSPERYYDLASGLSNAGASRTAQDTAIQNLIRRTPDTVETWLKKASLPPEQKQKYNQLLQNRQETPSLR